MKNRAITLTRAALLIIAILFVSIGFLKQEHFEVMQRAVKICLECIGIG